MRNKGGVVLLRGEKHAVTSGSMEAVRNSLLRREVVGVVLEFGRGLW